VNKATAYGYGSIYFRKSDGLWIATVNLPRRAGAARRRKTFSGHTREEAQARLDAYRADYQTAPPIKGGRRAYVARVADKGRHTYREWMLLVREVKGRCFYCDIKTIDRGLLGLAKASPDRATTRDHRTPLVRGGSDRIDNIAVSCQRCNAEKSTMTEDEYREWKAA
jgi:5-methylcytosine-specific restriction endonuclease McrA